MTVGGVLELPTLAEVVDEQARRRLLDWVTLCQPGFLAGWVHQEVCAALERFSADVAAGRSPRLMIFLPPRHAKSTIASQLWPVWHFGHHPGHTFVASSYAASLANRNSRLSQRVLVDHGQRLWPKLGLLKEAVEEWETEQGNVYKAVGVGGGLTGHGGHILLVDDPVKDREQAQSLAWRQKCKDWYTDVLWTRQAPGAGILVLMTRWHSDDLAGWLLSEAERDPSKEQWEVISFPAIAEEDEEHRRKGEALHPDRFPLPRLEAMRRLNPVTFASLYQQRPIPAEGGTIKADWLGQTYAKPQASYRRVLCSVDTAYKTAAHNDPSAILVAGERSDGSVDVLDVITGRWGYPELKRSIKSVALKWPGATWLVEDKASGQSLIQDLRVDQGWKHSVIPITPTADKRTRMEVEVDFIAAGRLRLPEAAPWLVDFRRELLSFPAGTHDDQADALSQLLGWLRTGSDTDRRIRILYGRG